MKTNKLLALLAMSSLFAFGCKPEPKPEPEEPYVPSTECKLVSLTVVTIDGEKETTLYSNDKVAELVYLPEDIAGLQNATLKVEVSEKATVNVAADQVFNLIAEKPQIVITAEDGVTTDTWTVEAVEATVAVSCEKVDEGVPGTFGISAVNNAGSSICFCGTDKIATINGEVYSFDGTKVGDLNKGDVVPADAQILAVDNDVNGVVVATFGFTAEGVSTTTNDSINYGIVCAWVNGYDQAPVVVYSNKDKAPKEKGNTIGYMHFAGDAKGDCILTTIMGGRGATQGHHVFEFHNGDFSAPTWHMFTAPYPSNDGNWGQTICSATGKVNDTFFIGDSMGNNLGYHVYTRQGVANTSEDVALQGTTMKTVPGVQDAGISDGNAQYGNYSTGNIKAFVFNGVPYVAVASTGWPEVYITIQSNDPSVDEEHYLLETQYFSAAQVVPSVAYVYDQATDTGHVILLGGNLVYARYDITREIL